ncbi:peptidoglycan DD-metalloendopeptidase family protein [Marinomonas mediterranea]|uniref:peptidoglycan DD-metalloendopeptidase family protein n=1 Tax=Marinomonas mediterranea TaxID=119864 RepID=UPI00234B7ED7|nr:peptidoglycan DD-metalloendopeptidase family protein [Marinomonas mediterranea]WCN08512.1 peptidoglycan DD-metalloendopeptidase family protein [Marinomonas mediterranea]
MILITLLMVEQRRNALKRFISVTIASLLLSACAYDSFHYPDKNSNSRTNASSRPQVTPMPATGIHKVQSGDTLFAIAFQYGLDYRKVAALNKIDSPYVIYPNQKIRLIGKRKALTKTTPPQKTVKPSKTTKQTASSSTKASSNVKNVKKVNSAKKLPSNNKKITKKVEKWLWPVDGKVIRGFSSSGVSSKGIDIKGTKGHHVKAVADGIVVYAGSGLIGYGKLVIIKHNEIYLSAYAYNERILVKEQQSVRAGDSLAIIGGKGSEKPLLHFEVRKDGQPVNPLNVLPKR